MAMEELGSKYSRIRRKVSICERAARTGNALSFLGTSFMFMSALPMIPIYLQMWFNVNMFITWPLCVIGSGTLMIAGRQINRSRGIVQPSTSAEERTFLGIYEVLRILEVYLQEGLPASKGEAVRKLRRINDDQLRGEDWKVGNLKILREAAGDQLDLLKNGFEQKLIPTVAHGDDDIQNTYTILIDFANYLINPKMDRLVSINETMSKLPFTEAKLPIHLFWLRKLVAYPLVKHAVAVGVGLAICTLTYYVGTVFFKVSYENAFISAVGLLGTFMSGYMALISKRSDMAKP